MKRYANIDIFNDVTRPSNILSSKDLVPTKTHEDRFQTDIIINGKTNFEKDNTIISSLNDEIVSLTEKMRFAIAWRSTLKPQVQVIYIYT